MMTPLHRQLNDALSRVGLFMALLILGVVAFQGLPGDARGDTGAGSGYVLPQQLRFGVLNTLRGVDQSDALVAVEMNFDRLADNYASPDPDFEVKLDFLPEVESAADLIKQRKLHALSLSAVDFLLLKRRVNVKPLLVASKLSTSPTEPFLIVSRKPITLKDLAKSAQRRIILEDKNQWDIGRIWLETLLSDNGLPDSTGFFTSIQSAAKPIRLVLPVFFGQADISLVPKSAYDTMVELNPQIGKKLYIMSHSPEFAKDLIATADYLDPGLIGEMKTAIIDMHTSDAGRQVLLIFQLQRFFPFQSEYLVDTERIFRKYEKLKKER